MERIQNSGQDFDLVNVKAMGTLIHEGNLQLLVNEQSSLEEIKSIWTALVGRHAKYVKDSHNKITHVPQATMQIIMQHKDQFSDGVEFENLPNGFGFTVTRVNNAKSILYFDNRLEAKSQESRKDSFLAPRIEANKKPLTDIGSVGQFHDFDDKKYSYSYQYFVLANQAQFQRVFIQRSDKATAEEFIAFIQVIGVFRKHNKNLFKLFQKIPPARFTCLLLDQGREGVVAFLDKLQQLKRS